MCNLGLFVPFSCNNVNFGKRLECNRCKKRKVPVFLTVFFPYTSWQLFHRFEVHNNWAGGRLFDWPVLLWFDDLYRICLIDCLMVSYVYLLHVFYALWMFFSNKIWLCRSLFTAKPDDKTNVKKTGIEIGKQASEKSKGLFSPDDWMCTKFVSLIFLLL